MVEGVYTRGSRCLIVEDVVTSGMSVLETSASLKEEGLDVTHAVVLCESQHTHMHARYITHQHGLHI